ncbi:hypothetical protein IX293_002020 [Fusobacterium necrophorum]|uniref:Uncharacterized protein n=1 Tax=Fusobacterium necrophorum BL TaxID=1441732 RepID=A0AB73BT71_9FUSO|nr:hypothetical protein [Fusobacterium necrophorum]KDE60784.1 hypothetical protein FUSO3_11905 [Fusobacterium necrophorum BL]KDE70724.1 hypothetical protein FUSO7_10415 [Fusobacterium necrophorum BFTR-2]MBR8823746.1 hypothetical protein [Fusobacterium necrophorum]
MEIKYIVGGNPFQNEEDFIEIFLNKTLSKEEIEILKKCKISYEYLENNILKLTVIDYGAYLVKVTEEEDRICLTKTEWYYEYIREVSHIEDRKENKNLVISENGTRIEILI